jgi:class 3 adenylate cyclase/tetratricopeptide (TPR) repeat protein
MIVRRMALLPVSAAARVVMTSLWYAYVPWHVARDLLRDPAADPIGREQRFDAVALFADVSGFTAISEALAVTGKRGAEELTAILNSYFAPMIELIVSYGGIVGKFGGDAMTVLFPYTRRTRRTVVRRALQCALDMQAAMGRYAAIPTSVGAFGLAMKAGLAEGSALCTTVGDPAIRLEYLIAGDLLDLCADAEHHATKGEVVAHLPLLMGAGPVEVIEERGHGDIHDPHERFACIARLGHRARPLDRRANTPPKRSGAPSLQHPPVTPVEFASAAADAVARYLHPSIADRLRAGVSGFLNEHRKVTVLFVSFSGFDYDHDPQVTQKLQAYLGEVIRVVQRYDGYVNKIDMGDKGSKYIVLFGAPLAHEDDEARGVRCALELQELPAPARIGVNTGVVFCGQVGSELRQEYTVMGDPVNLAARLMQAAQPGQVLVSGFTHRYAAAGFDWEALPPIRVKGKSEPIEVFTAVAVSVPHVQALRAPSSALPLVGRVRELAAAVGAIEVVRGGRGRILSIVAEAGMGKSRLAAAIVTEGAARELAVYGGACQAYGAQTSYLVWHDVWRGLFGVDPAWSPEAGARHVVDQLAALDARLAARAPLLAPALNLPIADNALTRSLDPQLRAELLRALLLDYLRRRVSAPCLIVLEDCHWIDPLSRDLLEFLGRNLADLPLLLLVIARPPDRDGGPLDWAARLAWFEELRLDELDETEAAELTRRKLRQIWGAGASAPAALVDLVAERAQGNPFYIEEIVNYLRDRAVDPQDAAALQRLELPDSLHSLVLSRIDQLAEAEKTTIKVASVIGRVFRANWLWGSYPPVGAPDEVRRHLQNLSRLDLTPLDRPEPEEEYLFKHITTQEVAYESLAYATRTLLHEKVGGFIEEHYPAEVDSYLDVLAYHYGRGADAAKQRIYFRRAGDAARQEYANEAAIDYYERLIPLLEGAERSEALVALGEIRQLTGAWGAAEELYRSALELADPAEMPRAYARAEMALGGLLASTQSFDEALRRLEAARAILAAHDDREGLGLALERAGLVYFEQGNYDRALEYAEQRLALARALGDPEGVSAALDNLGIVFFMRGDAEGALANLEQALSLAREAGLRRREIIAGNDLAGVCWGIGDYRSAMEHLQQALAVATEIGYLQQIGFMLGNAGLLYTDFGDYAPALRCFTRALQIAADLGDWPAIAAALGNLAFCLDGQGRADAADAVYERAIALGRSLGTPDFLAGDLYHRADLCARRGQYAAARDYNAEALAVAAEVERRDIQLQAAALDIYLQHVAGERDTLDAAAALAALAAEWQAPEEQAALHYAAWQIDPADEAARNTALAAYAALAAENPNSEYRRRHAALGGAELPPPPPLPELPQAAAHTAAGLDELLARIDVLRGGMGRSV